MSERVAGFRPRSPGRGRRRPLRRTSQRPLPPATLGGGGRRREPCRVLLPADTSGLPREASSRGSPGPPHACEHLHTETPISLPPHSGLHKPAQRRTTGDSLQRTDLVAKAASGLTSIYELLPQWVLRACPHRPPCMWLGPERSCRPPKPQGREAQAEGTAPPPLSWHLSRGRPQGLRAPGSSPPPAGAAGLWGRSRDSAEEARAAAARAGSGESGRCQFAADV